MSGLYSINDSIPSGNIIGAVAVYPSDDNNGHHEVPIVSRDIVDTFIKTHCRGESLYTAIIAAIARRMTARTGGETAQNINMLHMLVKIHNGEPIREDDPLFSEMAATEPIPTTDLRVSE